MMLGDLKHHAGPLVKVGIYGSQIIYGFLICFVLFSNYESSGFMDPTCSYTPNVCLADDRILIDGPIESPYN